MKKISSLLTLGVLAVLPFAASAQGLISDGTGNRFAQIIQNLVMFINSILIPAILALAFLVFVWGIFLYFIKGGADDEAKGKGRSLMIYALAGFVVILIFFGLVNLLIEGFGSGLEGDTITRPVGVEV